MIGDAALAQIRTQQVDAVRDNSLREYFDTADRYLEIIIDFLFRLPQTESKDGSVMLKVATVSLCASVVNQLEAARISLRAGLLQSATVLLRSAYEAVLLIDYLAIYPQQADRWAQGKEIRMSTVRKELTELSFASEVYRGLSEMSHPNLASVRSIIFNFEYPDAKDKATLGILVGGNPSDNQIIAWGQAYLASCLMATSFLLSDVSDQFEPQRLWDDLLERKSKLDEQVTNGLLHHLRTHLVND